MLERQRFVYRRLMSDERVAINSDNGLIIVGFDTFIANDFWS